MMKNLTLIASIILLMTQSQAFATELPASNLNPIMLVAAIKPTATPSPKPTIKPTATPTVKPTATPTVKPTATPGTIFVLKPTATPVPLVTPDPIFVVKPSIPPLIVSTATPIPTATPTVKPTATPTATPYVPPVIVTPVPTSRPVPTATPVPSLNFTLVRVGDQFIDYILSGPSQAYDVLVNGIPNSTAFLGTNRISGLSANDTVSVRIIGKSVPSSYTNTFRMKRQLYENRAYIWKIKDSDFTNLTYQNDASVTATYDNLTNYAVGEMARAGVTANLVSSGALVTVKVFEPLISCSAYTQPMSIDSKGFVTSLDVVYNPRVLESQPTFRNQKTAIHEFGHVLGLAHQNDGVLGIDDNIEPSIVRQGFVDWQGLQDLDLYNLSWHYQLKNSVSIVPMFDLHADTKEFKSLDELKTDSDSIIIAKPVSSVSLPSQNVTQTALSVSKVLKGDSVTSVYEPYYVNNGSLASFDKYQPMINGQTYVLFLKKHSNGSYMVNGISQGQYPTLTMDVASYGTVSGAFPLYQSIKQQVLRWVGGIQ